MGNNQSQTGMAAALLVLVVYKRKEIGFALAVAISTFFYLLGTVPVRSKSAGYNLPPVAAAVDLTSGFVTHGIDGMNRTINDLIAKYGSVFTVITPITQIIFVSDPSACQIVMTDREAYPGRPNTLGFRTFIPLGLLGLPTNEMWTVHRRLLSKGFSEPAMKVHCQTINSDLQVLLDRLAKHAKAVEASGLVPAKTQRIVVPHTNMSGNAVWEIMRQISPATVLDALRALVSSGSAAGGYSTAAVEAQLTKDMDRIRNSTYRFGQQTIDIHEELTRMTFDVIGKIAFGANFSTQTDRESLAFEASDILITEALRRSASPEITWDVPFGRLARFQWAREYARSLAKGTISAINDGIDPEIRQRIASSKNPMVEGNMVQAMLSAAVDEEKERAKKNPSAAAAAAAAAAGTAANGEGEAKRLISNEEVIQEALTLLGAGHETTANTSSSALLLLGEHPAVQSWLREELVAMLDPSGDPSKPFSPPNFTQWRKLERTQAVILEALRLFPTVPIFPRQCDKDTKLMGYDVPKGAWVFVHQDGLNKSKEMWGDPEVFRPQRFIVPGAPALSGFQHGIPIPNKQIDEDGKLKYQWSFLPFGAGPRSCLGRRLAMMESVMILSAIVANFTICLPNGISVESSPTKSDITLGHKFGLPVLLYPSHAVPKRPAEEKKKAVAATKASL